MKKRCQSGWLVWFLSFAAEITKSDFPDEMRMLDCPSFTIS